MSVDLIRKVQPRPLAVREFGISMPLMSESGKRAEDESGTQ